MSVAMSVCMSVSVTDIDSLTNGCYLLKGELQRAGISRHNEWTVHSRELGTESVHKYDLWMKWFVLCKWKVKMVRLFI